jgi:hypothetical protein
MLYAYNFYSFYFSSITYLLQISWPCTTATTLTLLATCCTFTATKEKSGSNPQSHSHRFYHVKHSLLHTISLSACHVTCRTNFRVLLLVKDSLMLLNLLFRATLCFLPNFILIFALLLWMSPVANAIVCSRNLWKLVQDASLRNSHPTSCRLPIIFWSFMQGCICHSDSISSKLHKATAIILYRFLVSF